MDELDGVTSHSRVTLVLLGSEKATLTNNSLSSLSFLLVAQYGLNKLQCLMWAIRC